MFFDKGPICMYDIINFTQLTYSACLCQFEDISARKKLADSPEYPKGMGGKNTFSQDSKSGHPNCTIDLLKWTIYEATYEKQNNIL